MIYKDIANTIIALKNADLQLRDQLIEQKVLGNGYHEAMKALHDKNANTLHQIIDQIGYPTIEKVGKEASEAAWLVIQHSIGQPDFMKKCAQLLEVEMIKNEIYHRNLAYLTDRIAFFEGSPQRYGTQFDWDKHGKLSPHPFDDLSKVNQRRAAIGLNTLEEQTEIIRQTAQNEHQKPPVDFQKRQKEFNTWRINIGWIK